MDEKQLELGAEDAPCYHLQLSASDNRGAWLLGRPAAFGDASRQGRLRLGLCVLASGRPAHSRAKPWGSSLRAVRQRRRPGRDQISGNDPRCLTGSSTLRLIGLIFNKLPKVRREFRHTICKIFLCHGQELTASSSVLQVMRILLLIWPFCPFPGGFCPISQSLTLQ